MTTIIIAIDGSSSSERAVHIGADIAKARNADVHLMTVVDPDQEIPEGVQKLASIEHLADPVSDARDMYASNVPSWMHEGLSAAASADRNIHLRQEMADIALQKGATILGEHGVQLVTADKIEGSAGKVIVDMATRRNAEFVVMGSRGLGSFKELLFGSTSNYVAEHADCFCITVN